MSVFDTLAEQRYQDWLERVSAPGYQPPPARETATRKSFEAHVFSDVLRSLDKAGLADSQEQQAKHLEKAEQLEMQLIILLERRGMAQAITVLRKAIAQRRQEVRERASTTPIKAMMKPAT